VKTVKPEFTIIDDIDPVDVLKKIESIGRVCYKSEDKITPDSATGFIKMLIDRGHTAMLEHVSISVKFITDRGVTHEMVRHRLAAFAQESTRYCNYATDKFGKEITVVEPPFFDTRSEAFRVWAMAMKYAECAYLQLLELGASPQEARSVLPNSLKTEIVITANLREWRHILDLRTAETAHPQMREVMRPLLDAFKSKIPVVFDDLSYEAGKK
jgi:thymidylate synthase (FAD)